MNRNENGGRFLIVFLLGAAVSIFLLRSRASLIDVAPILVFVGFFVLMLRAVSGRPGGIRLNLAKGGTLKEKTVAPLGALLGDQQAITITYRSTPEATMRCLTYASFQRPSALFSFLWLGAIGAGLVAILTAKSLPGVPAPLLFLLSLPLTTCGLFRLLLQMELRQRFPTPDTTRICTSSLIATGFHDVAPGKVGFAPWKQIAEIRENNGDVYVWTTSTNGFFVPAEAFESVESAREFCRAATVLWKSNGTTWPEPAR